MKKYMYSTLLTALMFGLIFVSSSYAAEKVYKDYKSSSSNSQFFEITFDPSYVGVKIFIDQDEPIETGYYRRDLEFRDDEAYIDDKILVDERGLHLAGQLLEWDRIKSFQVVDDGSKTSVIFKKKTEDTNSPSSKRRGNIIQYSRDIEIDNEEFIRGALFTVFGNIYVRGEVNRDIVSLFGDIQINGDAVIRGDIAAVSGDIDISNSATVYGDILQLKSDKRSRSKRDGRRGRFYRHARNSDFDAGLIYNRVDGAHPWGEYTFSDGDSLLPTVTVCGGYAFNSERWRYAATIEQTIMRNLPVSVGLGFYRKLISEDDWLLSSSENNVFALMAHEDFKDYYEADGGFAFLRVKPLSSLTFEAKYQQDETKWLDASRHLWSVFGGDKLFDENFATVDPISRNSGKLIIDNTTIGSAYFSIRYEDKSDNRPFAYNATTASAELEISNPDLKSDFDYHRYTIAATHNFRLNRRGMISLKARYGGSKGDLPMHKRFYLGGLGTLRGYSHKEFSGSEFWLANAEYKFELPGTSIALGLLYDVAQIDDKLNGDTKTISSVGLAAYLSEDLRISVAKQLDDGDDNNAKIYVRLTGDL